MTDLPSGDIEIFKDLGKRIVEHLKQTEGHVAVTILYGRQIPVIPILETPNTELLLVGPDFIPHAKKHLDIHP